MINTKINQSRKTIEIDSEMDLLIIEMETVEKLEILLVLYRLRGETSQKTFHTVNQEVIKVTIVLSADLTTDP